MVDFLEKPEMFLFRLTICISVQMSVLIFSLTCNIKRWVKKTKLCLFALQKDFSPQDFKLCSFLL